MTSRKVQIARRSGILPYARRSDPLTCTLSVGSLTYRLSVWTPERWAALPERDRPGDAHPMDGGGWYTLTRLADDAAPPASRPPS